MTDTAALKERVLQQSFENATRGWRQCTNILRDTTKALDFAINEIITHQPTFEPNAQKAHLFADAMIALRTAQRYCKSQWPEAYEEQTAQVDLVNKRITDSEAARQNWVQQNAYSNKKPNA